MQHRSMTLAASSVGTILRDSVKQGHYQFTFAVGFVNQATEMDNRTLQITPVHQGKTSGLARFRHGSINLHLQYDQ
jgi:hypothetical protein